MDEQIYKTMLTAQGKQTLFDAIAKKQAISLVKMKLGDGQSELNAAWAELPNIKHELEISSIIEGDAEGEIKIEGVIPADVGGFTIRQIGVFSDSGILFAIANVPPTTKPLVSQGSAKDLRINFHLAIGEASAVVLSVDKSTVLASKQELNNEIEKLKKEMLIVADVIDDDVTSTDKTWSSTKINTTINTKANSTDVVKLTGNQTIAGTKTFSALPVCDTAPTDNNHLANKKYVDDTKTNLTTTINNIGPGFNTMEILKTSGTWTAKATGWHKITCIGGGGGGGSGNIYGDSAGGGGSGGISVGYKKFEKNTAYSFVIGAGGIGATTVAAPGGDGGDTSFDDIIAYGGKSGKA